MIKQQIKNKNLQLSLLWRKLGFILFFICSFCNAQLYVSDDTVITIFEDHTIQTTDNERKQLASADEVYVAKDAYIFNEESFISVKIANVIENSEKKKIAASNPKSTPLSSSKEKKVVVNDVLSNDKVEYYFAKAKNTSHFNRFYNGATSVAVNSNDTLKNTIILQKSAFRTPSFVVLQRASVKIYEEILSNGYYCAYSVRPPPYNFS